MRAERWIAYVIDLCRQPHSQDPRVLKRILPSNVMKCLLLILCIFFIQNFSSESVSMGSLVFLLLQNQHLQITI